MVRVWVPITLSCCFALIGCRPEAPVPVAPRGVEPLRASVERDANPAVTDEALAEAVAGNTAFACDLYGKLAEGDSNVFFSPYSVSSALAMVYAGARGETEKQMADVLGFAVPQEPTHAAFNKLDTALSDAAGDDATLLLANALWPQTGEEFEQGFLDTLGSQYGAALWPLAFGGDPEGARKTINDWADANTQGRIKDLLPPRSLDGPTPLVLTNAVYFLADWKHQFDKAVTKDQPFHRLDGSDVQAPMMRQTEDFGYADGDGWKALAMPYRGDRLEMLAVLPVFERFDEIEARLEDVLAEADASRHKAEVIVAFPRFEMTTPTIRLRDQLRALGMTDAFDEQAADFTGALAGGGFWIDDVYHKAYVRVDEKGTEAAAATAVATKCAAAPGAPLSFIADHPFVFLIRDTKTKTILFLGRVMDPTV